MMHVTNYTKSINISQNFVLNKNNAHKFSISWYLHNLKHF